MISSPSAALGGSQRSWAPETAKEDFHTTGFSRVVPEFQPSDRV